METGKIFSTNKETKNPTRSRKPINLMNLCLFFGIDRLTGKSDTLEILACVCVSQLRITSKI